MRILLALCLIPIATGLRVQPHQWIASQEDQPLDTFPNDEVDDLERQVEKDMQQSYKPAHLKSQVAESAAPAACTGDPEIDAKTHGGVGRGSEICQDPWYKDKVCSKPFQVGGYRLGDIFWEPWYKIPGHLQMRGKLHRHTKFFFPKSIGAKYLASKTKLLRDTDTLNKVIDSDEYKDFEKPDDDTVTIHVRGFDAFKEGSKKWYIKEDEYYPAQARNAANAHYKKAVIVTGDHLLTQNNGNSSKTKEKLNETLELTNQKIDAIQKIFEKEGFKVSRRFNYNADCDFIYMVNSKAFVPSGGGFDLLVEDVIKNRNGTIFGKAGGVKTLYG